MIIKKNNFYVPKHYKWGRILNKIYKKITQNKTLSFLGKICYLLYSEFYFNIIKVSYRIEDIYIANKIMITGIKNERKNSMAKRKNKRV